ncbi:hypothetical protein DFH09DRAFT_1186208 [Mycena vulgaris]|nr:hypothetical protein DFH09DRAFT_1186208 [Mycena vulgaris]
MPAIWSLWAFVGTGGHVRCVFIIISLRLPFPIQGFLSPSVFVLHFFFVRFISCFII